MWLRAWYWEGMHDVVWPKDALKSVHLRHAEKCELHAVADEELFILGVVCRGSIGWQRPEDAKPSCSILRFKHWLRHHVCAVYAQFPKAKRGGGDIL